MRNSTSPHAWRFILRAGCSAGLIAFALLPAQAQTTAGNDKAQERSQQQSDSVYRWIKYFADQPKKAAPSKARPKVDAPVIAKKPETKAPTAPLAPPLEPKADTVTGSDTASTSSAAPPSGSEAPLPTAAQTPASTPPSSPEPEPDPTPEAVADTIQPLKPVVVVDPTIPREMRDEVIHSSVLLSFTVEPDGTVASPTVVNGTDRKLNRSALNAIAQWRFEPIQTARTTQIEFAFSQE